MRKINYDFLECAKCMPPLFHSQENQFDIKETQKWIGVDYEK